MVGRLVYEVRLKPLDKGARSKLHKKWRWDAEAYLTTDPINPGVEDGRWHLGGKCGYERFRWSATKRIADFIADNPYRDMHTER